MSEWRGIMKSISSSCAFHFLKFNPTVMDTSVKHNSAKNAKADMIGVRVLFTIATPTIPQRLKTESPTLTLLLVSLLERTRTLLEMAQTQSRKRKSDLLDEQDHDLQTSTPTGSPARKRAKITRSQKQALIDNLQLESGLPRCLGRVAYLTW
jgi:hypothetical protein